VCPISPQFEHLGGAFFFLVVDVVETTKSDLWMGMGSRGSSSGRYSEVSFGDRLFLIKVVHQK
jgi:hypothetical protein